MSDLGDGFRGLADVVDLLEDYNVRVSEADPTGWDDTLEDGYLSARLVVGVPIDGLHVDDDTVVEAADDLLEQLEGLAPPDPVTDMPESRRRIYALLEREGELDSRTIHETLGIAFRTTTDGLNELEEAGVVTSRPDPDDGRRTLYALADEPGPAPDSDTEGESVEADGGTAAAGEPANPYHPTDLGTVEATEATRKGGKANGVVVYLPPRIVEVLPEDAKRLSVIALEDGELLLAPGVKEAAVADHAISGSRSPSGSGLSASIGTSACRELGIETGDEYRAHDAGDGRVRLVPEEGSP